MEINQNKTNQVIKKLFAKSFINAKIDDQKFTDSNKKTKGKYFLKNSSSTKKNLKKNLKSNELRENYQNKNITNQNTLKIKEYSNNSKDNKKRSVILNKVKQNLNKKIMIEKDKSKERQNKIFNFLNKKNNISNNVFKNSILNNYNHSVGYNQTINHIRIKNPKLNSVLFHNNENKILNDKTINFCLSKRNYNRLYKDKSINRSINYSINKENNKEIKKRINNSFRTKGNSNNFRDNFKLKIKLKKNKSIEKENFNYDKMEKKYFNTINADVKKRNKLNKTLVQNYTCPFNKSWELNSNDEIDNKIDIISSYIHISFNSKDKDKNKNSNNIIENNSRKKKLNLDFLKEKLDNLKNNNINDGKNGGKLNKTIKEKSKTSFLPFLSESNQKKKKRNKKEKKNIIKKVIIKKNKNIRKRNNIINNHYNSEIIKNEKINRPNNLIKNINNKEENKENDKKNDNIDIVNDNYYNSLPSNNLNNSDIFDSNINKNNSNIFEVISDVKVKSMLEYEKDKNNLSNIVEKNKCNNKIANKNLNDDNAKEINSNININEILDGSSEGHKKNINVIENNEEKKEKGEYIEDRDEYNVILKETFSKDRFSFRPTNNDSNETFQDSKTKVLDSKDFLIDKEISSSTFVFDNKRKKKIPFKKKNIKTKNIGSNMEKIKKLIKSITKESKINKK